MRRATLTTLLSIALVTTGCGGGGGTSPPAPVTVTILSTDELDGIVGSGGDFSLTGDVVQAGDSTTNLGYRGFVSFELGVIPAGATVLTATLRLVQKKVTGDPYGSMGPVLLDQVVYGNVLESGAFARSFPQNQAFATLSTNATLEAKTVDATAPVQGDRASLRTQSQYRLRFAVESDLDTAFDLANFYSGNPVNPVDLRPTLTVTYQP